MPFEIQPGNEGFVASDDDHDDQIGDHHYVNQAQDRQHNGRFIDGRGFFYQVPEFFEEKIDINSLGHDQAEVERGLEPSAKENEIAQNRQPWRAWFYGLIGIHG